MESDFGTPVSWSHWSRSSKLNHDQNLVKEKTSITNSHNFLARFCVILSTIHSVCLNFARHFQPCSEPAWRLLIGTLSCWFTDFQINILRQWKVGNTNLHMIGKFRQTLPRQPTRQPTTSRQPTCCRACGAILSSTPTASIFRFRPSPHDDFEIQLWVLIGLCLVTAWASANSFQSSYGRNFLPLRRSAT